MPRQQVLGLLVHGNHLSLAVCLVAGIVTIDFVLVPRRILTLHSVIHDLTAGILNHLSSQLFLVLVFGSCKNGRLFAHFSILFHQELIGSSILASRHFL